MLKLIIWVSDFYACAVIKLDHPTPSPIGQLTHFCPKSLNLLPLLRWPPCNFPWYPWSDAMFSTQHRYPTHFYAPTWLSTPQWGILNPSCWLFLSLNLAEGQTQSQHSINTRWTNNIQYYCIYTIYSRLFFSNVTNCFESNSNTDGELGVGWWRRIFRSVSLHYLKIFCKQVIFYNLKNTNSILFQTTWLDWRREERLREIQQWRLPSLYPCESFSLESDYPTVAFLGTSLYYQAFLPLSSGCLIVYAFKI